MSIGIVLLILELLVITNLPAFAMGIPISVAVITALTAFTSMSSDIRDDRKMKRRRFCKGWLLSLRSGLASKQGTKHVRHVL